MSLTPFSRRHFLNAAAATTIGTVTLNLDLQAAPAGPKLKEGDVILCQGDSITDAGRDRANQDKPNHPAALGRGYPFFLAGDLLTDHAALGLKIYDRGISGNKVPDLAARWQTDTLDLKPAVLSILVGVNDIWHKLNGRYDGTPEVYRDGFAALLDQTKKALPDTTIVICEPFVLRCGAINDTWFPEFDTRRQYAREVSDKAGTLWVPFQKMFDDAVAAGTQPAYWAADGVHPTIAGHTLMANAWRKVVGI